MSRDMLESMCYPYFLRVAYVGTGFSGWQIQSTLRSVQGELWLALRAFDPQVPMPQGTGRTDAGVHAKAQGVIITTTKAWEPFRLQAAINAHLTPEIRVMQAMPIEADFWPRQHAVAKQYIYRLWEGPCESPFEHLRRWHVRGSARLDQNAIREALPALVGEHDFSSFRHQECAAKTPIRHIYAIELQATGQALDLVFNGNRFLMHQVRIMAGTLVDIGKGRIPPHALAGILQAKDRTQAGRTAPPHGLYLEQVWYQRKWNVGEPSPWGEEAHP